MARGVKKPDPADESWLLLGKNGSWRVSKHTVTGDVYIEHKCEEPVLMLASGDGICYGCFREAPSDILALFKLARM